MQTQTEKNTAEISVKMTVDAWKSQNERVDKFLAEISDDELKAEIATGKNSGVYLVGHLAAVNDGLFQMFGIGEKLYPQLEEVFLKNAEDKSDETVSIDDLKKYWAEINSKLSEKFSTLSPEDWFEKHTAVSAENFAKEPHRNKLNVLLNRTIHQSYHLGQLNLLVKK